MSKKVLYGKVRHAGIPRKKLNGKDTNAVYSLIEIEEQFYYDGLFFNVHRGRESKNKFGVSESTTGLSVSMKKGSKDLDGYLHKTKAEAIKQAFENFDFAKTVKGRSITSFVYEYRANSLVAEPIIVQLKKMKLK